MRQSSKNRGKLRIAAIAAITAMVLGGCASSSPKDTYGLSLPHVDGGAMKRGRQLLIADPVALKTLDSENIVIRVGSQEYQYLNDSQWSDKLPKLVQLKLAQAFENSGKIGGAGLPGEGLAIDYQVQTNIRAFEISVAEHAAIVELAVRILNDRNGTVRSRYVARAVVPVEGSGNTAYIKALDRAFARATDDIVSWALGVI